MKTFLGLIYLPVAVAALAFIGVPSVIAAPAASVAEVHDCHTYAFYPNVLISSARNMGCRTARTEMRSYRGSINYRFTTPRRHFRCRRVSGERLGGQWRCVRGDKAFRFNFAD